MASTETPLIVYGASWCPDCRRAKQFLASHRVPYEWIDLEEFPEKTADVEARNDGKRIIPTIVFPDGTFLAEPSNDELADRIGLSRVAEEKEYDLIIVGGGPTGLTTSIYGARENARVLIVEKSAPGGQAGVTERFDNYPGFPDGVGGAELAERMTQQAQRYGVEILQAVGATRVERDGPMLRVDLSTGDFVLAPVVLCATCDGPFYRGAKDLTVVGGGNSGLEEGLFLTQFADHVTVVQGMSKLTANKLLQDKVTNHPKMSVLLDTSVTSFNANASGRLESITVTCDGTEATHETAGAFIFIGLDPNTDFLENSLDVDERGFIVTDAMFHTSVDGIFAAGDVRAGSTKQIASAVGEGAAVAIQIRYYLDPLDRGKVSSWILL